VPEIQYAKEGGRPGPHSARGGGGGGAGRDAAEDRQAKRGGEEEAQSSRSTNSSAAETAVTARHGGSRRGRIPALLGCYLCSCGFAGAGNAGRNGLWLGQVPS